jgi:hypothetical protein
MNVEFSIVTQIRNESKRLKDWIIYHQKIGINHFVFFLDNCSDNSEEVLNELKKDINIDIFQANQFGSYPLNNDPTKYVNYDVVPRIKNSLYRGLKYVKEKFNHNDNHWVIFTEVDEYIVPQTKISLSSIVVNCPKNRIYIASYDFKCPFDLDIPVYNQTFWRWSDDIRKNGYVNNQKGYFSNRGKSLVKTNTFLKSEVDIHDADHSEYFQDDELLKINHYRNNGEMQIYDFEDKKIIEWL